MSFTWIQNGELSASELKFHISGIGKYGAEWNLGYLVQTLSVGVVLLSNGDTARPASGRSR